ncbi:MAG: hypothetical protein OJF59_001835 [Cytophagales bacterium]|jgi:hypothetical protein|nr:DUF4917 family protein [Bacteroidota bacterium]MBS1950695.1 DUF4917 family protein [Bacteroidota bacterium]MBS1980745.1 DUF4917 family protein [Bacteroidota bacterium]WHZ08082.1 MAG: hypothetical protein OJF59_001835 [Cytophagales bacterium]
MITIGDIKVYHWSEIKHSFKGADIFLGNGFSININSALNYKSLFEKFLTYLDDSERGIFLKFNSTNFEGLQNLLSNALDVNQLFGYEAQLIGNSLRLLKSGLLKAIKDLHPEFTKIDPQTLFQSSIELDWFENVFTTNYDIFLYHIILITLDRGKRDSKVGRYQDFFRKKGTELVFNDKPLPGFKNIYYLHGALFFHKQDGIIVKISRGSKTEELLELIRLQIHLGNVPIFVSEGKAKLKEDTIAKSIYLSFCRAAFKASHNRLVIYGFSFSDYDEHLINDLNENKRKLAIGVHLSNLNEDQIQRKLKGIEKQLYNYKASEIKYFDSRTLF